MAAQAKESLHFPSSHKNSSATKQHIRTYYKGQKHELDF
jgi:hypothetical protein